MSEVSQALTAACSTPQTITFGCRLNSYESDIMRGHAVAAGLHNAVIINTCTVTAEAERQARQAIRRARREQPQARIIVTGCAAQIDPGKFAAMEEVDHVVGNDAKLKAESFRALSNDAALPIIKEEAVSFAQNAEMQRAFVQVQNGCDHRCTFCIIPYGRGASKSLPLETIAMQLRHAVNQGFNEAVLTGVDIASYGKDLLGQPSLGQMIKQVLAQVPELPRLRLSSVDPAAIDEDLWQLIDEEPRLMPHLHLSLQAGDDMILKRMKRRHLRDDILKLCERARRLRPEMVFGADVIAGFPTESEAMFDTTFALLRECDFTWLHVFPYSARKGTPAAKMPQLHGDIRKERAEKLRVLGDTAARRHYAGLIGKTVEVLGEKNHIGCTPQFARVKLTGDAPAGQLIRAECYALENNQILARPL